MGIPIAGSRHRGSFVLGALVCLWSVACPEPAEPPLPRWFSTEPGVWMNSRDVLRSAITLANAGARREALELLEAELARVRATPAGRSEIALLARTAGVLSTELEEIDRALAYYEEVRLAVPGDPFVYLALGHIHATRGDIGAANESYKSFTDLADPETDGELIGIVKSRIPR